MKTRRLAVAALLAAGIGCGVGTAVVAADHSPVRITLNGATSWSTKVDGFDRHFELVDATLTNTSDHAIVSPSVAVYRGKNEGPAELHMPNNPPFSLGVTAQMAANLWPGKSERVTVAFEVTDQTGRAVLVLVNGNGERLSDAPGSADTWQEQSIG